MPPSRYNIQCIGAVTKSGGDEELRLSIDGEHAGVKLLISQLNKQMVAGLPDRALDLLEIAALVYAADAAVSRGGPADQQMGRKWHRQFNIEMPVRDLTFWTDHGLLHVLEEALMFLTGDRFEFTFLQKKDADAERSRFFKFGADSAWRPNRVLMFSGGLDSFSGALEEIAEHSQRVALVSHFSASKIAPIQRSLSKALATKFGPDVCQHVPVQVQMTGGSMKEGTHRSRSFLFAALGAIAAQAFGLDRVSFYENGVVSLNLPPVGNVLGTRATRTTHPQTLARFTDFFGRVFKHGCRIDNPYFWRTKKDVVEAVSRLGMKDQIAHTRSCADVHNQTKQYPHCGRCSQCIDRRFAILAAGLSKFDPEEAYRVALMKDSREGAVDRETALSFVRNAHAFEHMTPPELERLFPAVLDAVNYLDQPPETTLSMITDLLRRHGTGVSNVMRQTLANETVETFADNSLPRLYGDAQRQVVLPAVRSEPVNQTSEQAQALLIEIDEPRCIVVLDRKIEIARNVTADLLIELSKSWLTGAGKGLPPLDFPLLQATRLADRFGLDGEEAVRRRVLNARNLLTRRLVSCGFEASLGKDIIENIPWRGYRLAPDRVVVRRRLEKG